VCTDVESACDEGVSESDSESESESERVTSYLMVCESHTTHTCLRARVIATLVRRSSVRKPTTRCWNVRERERE